MEVYPPANPELVPEIQGPFYEGAQVRLCVLLVHVLWPAFLGYIKTSKMDYAKR